MDTISKLNSNLIIVIALVSLAVIVCLAVFSIRKARYRKWNEEVLSTSRGLKMLSDLNGKQMFYTDVKETYPYKFVLDTKNKYDRFDFDAYYHQIVNAQAATFSYLHRHLKDNRIKWNEYMSMCSQIRKNYCSMNTSKVPEDFYRKVEGEAFEQRILHPIISSEIEITAVYTSPQGRNSYQKRRSYPLDLIPKTLIKIQEQRAYAESEEARRKRERAKVTPSLRYDVLKRDGFRCCYCGRSQADGVKLHVDHIIPVAKGGRTELSNLQTLCAECNMGKRDKYDREYKEDDVIRGIVEELNRK